MTMSFEPGDGSFELTLANGESLPAEWNVSGVAAFRETTPGTYTLIKGYNQIL